MPTFWILACKEAVVGGEATISQVAATATTATYTAPNTFQAGNTVSISGLTHSQFNGNNLTIVLASGSQFTVNGTYTVQAPTSDNGAAIVQQGSEGSGGIFVTRLPQTISDTQPGTPDNWYFVGPGGRPSIQSYNGNQYVLTFDYLSHLFCRVVDDPNSVWPPAQVNPVQVSGGPNPPTAFTYALELAQDSLTLKTEGSVTFGLTAAFYNPVFLQFPLLFLDPTTNTYSVTIEPLASYQPQVPLNNNFNPTPTSTAYFRLYSRPYPYTGSWTLIMDWTAPSNYTPGVGYQYPIFTFLDSHVGSLRYQYSAIWGSQWAVGQPFNLNEHSGGIIGETYITVDSTVVRASYQATVNESLTLGEVSDTTFGYFGPKLVYIDESVSDAIELSKSELESGFGDAFAYFGPKQAFFNESASDVVYGYSASEASKGGNAFCHVGN